MKIFRLGLAGQSETIQCGSATTLVERTVGLLGRSSLSSNEALMINPCKQVHTFFMRFPIDVLFLSEENVILGVESLKPWRVSSLYWKARKVVEMEYQKAQRLGFEKGKKVEILP